MSAVKAVDQIVYIANGCGGVVDELRFEDVIRLVRKIGVPPPRVARQSSQPTPDALAQLRKLGELRSAGVLTDEEFDAKKTELPRRV